MNKEKQKFNLIGILKITQKDKYGNIIDKNIVQNTIMDNARYNVMNFLNGINYSRPISRFVLGTDGVDTNGTPKVFSSDRTETFSEESGAEWYYLDWDVDASNGDITVTAEEGNPATNSTVLIETDNAAFTKTWKFNIPLDNANGSGSRPYSEAALYAKDTSVSYNKIFSMKTYPVRTKDDTVTLEIEWTIQLG